VYWSGSFVNFKIFLSRDEYSARDEIEGLVCEIGDWWSRASTIGTDFFKDLGITNVPGDILCRT